METFFGLLLLAAGLYFLGCFFLALIAGGLMVALGFAAIAGIPLALIWHSEMSRHGKIIWSWFTLMIVSMIARML